MIAALVVAVVALGSLTGVQSSVPTVEAEPSAQTMGQASAASDAWTPPKIDDTSVPDFVDPGTAFAPRVTFGDAVGAGTTLERFHVGGVRFAINRASGSLVIDTTDVIIAGDGVGLSFGRSFDSAATGDTTMGVGWSSSGDRGLRLEESNAAVYAASGYRTVFTPAPDGGYAGPAGTGLVLQRTDVSPERTFQLTDPGTGHRQYFSANGYLTGESDRHDIGVVYRYDNAGNLVLAAHPLSGRSIAFGYGAGRLVFATDSAGRVTSYSRDDQDRLTKIVDGAGAVTSFDYGEGRLVAIHASVSPTATGTLKPGRAGVAFGYDDSGRVISVTAERTVQGRGEQAATTFLYGTAVGTEVTDELGRTTSFRFDPSTAQSTLIDPAGATSTAAWTGDEVTAITDPLSATTSTAANAAGEPSAAALPTGATGRLEYAASDTCASTGAADGQLNCIVDPQGNRTAVSYTESGDVSAVQDGVGVIRSFAYDGLLGAGVCPQGRGLVCSTTDGIGVRTFYRYDAARQLIGIQVMADDTLRPVASYSYDPLGRVTEVLKRGLDGLGELTTTYDYDRADRVVGVTYPDGIYRTVDYNADGTMASQRGLDGTVTDYEYDYRGLLVRTVSTEADVGSQRRTTAYAYDAVGNLISHVDPSGATEYRYGPTDLLLSVLEPGSPEASGDCSAGVPAAASGCTVFEYDAAGRETARVFPGGARQSSGYDASGRMTSLTATDASGTPRVSIGYRYTDLAGTDLVGTDTALIQRRTSTLEQGIPAGAVTDYGYDARNRLVAATESTTDGTVNASWGYSYDVVDNRVRQIQAGATSDAALPTAPAQVTSYNYDGIGRILSTSADTAAWKYDDDGNLVRNGITGVESEYGYGSLVSAGRVAANVDYLATPAGDRVGFAHGGAFHYYVRDAAGSVVGIFDNTGSFDGGYSYSPYGELRSAGDTDAVAANPVRFAGGLVDLANPSVSTFGAREYDSRLGRFLQPDPLGRDLFSFTYAHDDPVNFVDTNGLLEEPAAGIGVGLAMVFFSLYATACLTGSVFVCGLGLLVSLVADASVYGILAWATGGNDVLETDIDLAALEGIRFGLGLALAFTWFAVALHGAVGGERDDFDIAVGADVGMLPQLAVIGWIFHNGLP
jgi:RHS repeat-associated protein